MRPEAFAAAFAVGLLIAILVFIAFADYNAVVALRQRIDKAWANVDVALKQRHDQLPALVAAVRGLMTFEQDVLTDVTRPSDRSSPSWKRIQRCARTATYWTSRTRSSDSNR
jgi:hypothetical protein